MEGEHTDILIQELFALEPSLKEHETEVRNMLAEIIAKRPHVRIDDAFRVSLRARLLTTKPKVIVSPYTELSWWAVRLVPLGAVALLLITLVPGDILHAPTVLEEQSVMTTTEDAETMDASESSRSVTNEAFDVSSAPSLKTPGGGGDVDDAEIAADSMMLSVEMPPTHLYSMNVTGQPPGASIAINSVTTQAPAFIVIHRYDRGTPIIAGISPLIMYGTTTNIPIYLRRISHVGEFYTATLVSDNGNRVFTETEDMPLLDPVEIEIISGYFE